MSRQRGSGDYKTIWSIVSCTAAYTADAGQFVKADATSAAFSVKLPTAANLEPGDEVAVIRMNSGTNLVTVDGNGANINGAATDTSLSAQYAKHKYVWDGSNWFALS